MRSRYIDVAASRTSAKPDRKLDRQQAAGEARSGPRRRGRSAAGRGSARSRAPAGVPKALGHAIGGAPLRVGARQPPLERAQLANDLHAPVGLHERRIIACAGEGTASALRIRRWRFWVHSANKPPPGCGFAGQPDAAGGIRTHMSRRTAPLRTPRKPFRHRRVRPFGPSRDGIASLDPCAAATRSRTPTRRAAGAVRHPRVDRGR